MANDSESTMWRLEKYARYILQKPGSSAGHWKYYDDSAACHLVMTLTDTKHLVVLQGSVVLESHSLVTARAWMRGMSKNDSLLFLYKQGKGTRRFKVKFADAADETGRQVCQTAAHKLSALFSIHLTTPAPVNSDTRDTMNEKSCDAVDTKTTSAPLHGDVPLATMAQVVLGGSTRQLPDAYTMMSDHVNKTGMTSWPDDVMASHLRLFLADPTFPAFVAKVDAQLQDLMKECQE